jgi:hypothetical protein
MERTIGTQIKLLKLYLSILLLCRRDHKFPWNTFGLQRILALTLTVYFVCLQNKLVLCFKEKTNITTSDCLTCVTVVFNSRRRMSKIWRHKPLPKVSIFVGCLHDIISDNTEIFITASMGHPYLIYFLVR